MVIKKIETRDYLRTFITKANKEAGVTFNASKLNSIKECEDYLLNLVKNLRHNKQDNKAYMKEIDSLKEEIEILNNNLLAKNKEKANLKDKFEKLEAERIFYITQAPLFLCSPFPLFCNENCPVGVLSVEGQTSLDSFRRFQSPP